MPVTRKNKNVSRSPHQNWWLLVHSYDINGPIFRNEHFWCEPTNEWVKQPKEATLYRSKEEAFLQSGKLAQRNILSRAVRADRINNPVTPNTVVVNHMLEAASVPMTVVKSVDGKVVLSSVSPEGTSSLTVNLENYVRWVKNYDLEVIWDPDAGEMPESNESYLISVGLHNE